MKEIATYSPQTGEACTGYCNGCGKMHIKIFGQHDDSSRLLHAHVQEALALADTDGKVLEVTEPGAIAAAGVTALPALMVEGILVAQGVVPDATAIVHMLKHTELFKSKLYRLNKISVPVDMSEVSANALVFAWELARKTGSNLEVIYAMDSIFEGAKPSASGFLSGYAHTMQQELEGFITETLKEAGAHFEPPTRFAGMPGQVMSVKPQIRSKLIYGAPDVALSTYSAETDLIVMGATGRGGWGKRLFGSVSVEVSRAGHCPIIFVPKEAAFRGFSSMLYASDFDSLSPLCVQQTVAFAKRFGGQIHFVHVGPGAEHNLETQRSLFEANFDEATPDKPFIFSKMVSDDIVGALYEYAFYHRIDLLVFVTHQRNFWDNILHKSVTNEVLASSDLPILVIHSDDDLVLHN